MKKISNKLFYQSAIKEFGVSPQGVHWNNQYSQYKRFEIITSFIRKQIKNSSIVDVGCGFGEYYHYLDINNVVPEKYIGIDCEEKMISISKKRFPKQEFHLQNILHDKLIKADYYLSSGALNILNYDECKLFIKKCYDSSNQGFIFNFLKNITFNNIPKEDIIDISRGLSNKIKIKEGYLDNDFTVFIIK